MVEYFAKPVPNECSSSGMLHHAGDLISSPHEVQGLQPTSTVLSRLTSWSLPGLADQQFDQSFLLLSSWVRN